MREFLQRPGELPQEPLLPFGMEHMRRDLESYQIARNRALAQSSGWAAEFKPFDTLEQANHMHSIFPAMKLPDLIPAGLTSTESGRLDMGGSGGSAYPLQRSTLAMNGYMTGYPQSAYQLGNYSMGDVDASMAYRAMLQSRSQASSNTTSKGKARVVELPEANWEQQFAEIDAAGQQELDEEVNAAIEEELNQQDNAVLSEGLNQRDVEMLGEAIRREVRGQGDFDTIYQDLKAAAETEELAAQDLDDLDLQNLPSLNSLHNAWDSTDMFPDMRDPQFGNYLFEEKNLFATTTDPYNEGLKILREGGNLSLASLAFEAAVKRDPDFVAAWAHLGSTQAQNEKEAAAIRALEQTLKLDPQNLPALMGLAISYTNEGYDTTAYRTLERWLSVKYPQIIPPNSLTPEMDIGFADRHELHQKVTDLFIRAARLSPQGDAMDPDVQVGLGVLFYGAEEYSKAIDCFEAALASSDVGTVNHPSQAHLLWNRLGATMANSGRSEEAIDAYEQALRLNPNFVRARYNLGVSCMNIGCYVEAAQHLLGALSMHRIVEGEGKERVLQAIDEEEGILDLKVDGLMGMNQSTNLLDTLRRLFGTTMGRTDLSDKVQVGMDVEAFRAEFGF